MTLRVVRSGKYGERETLALDSGLAVIGWDIGAGKAGLIARNQRFQ